jgi:hypothetical protein
MIGLTTLEMSEDDQQRNNHSRLVVMPPVYVGCLKSLLYYDSFEYISLYTMIDVYRCQLYEVRRGWYVPPCSSVRWQFERNFNLYMMDNDGWSRFFHVQTAIVGQQCLQWDIDYFIIAWQTCVPWSKKMVYGICFVAIHSINGESSHSGDVNPNGSIDIHSPVLMGSTWKDHQLTGHWMHWMQCKPSETMKPWCFPLSKIWPSTSCTISHIPCGHVVHF